MSIPNRLCALLVTSSVFSLAGPALAQAADHGEGSEAVVGDGRGESADQGSASAENRQLDEIVVTAEKRAGSVQDSPLAITAIGGGDLDARGIADIEALAPLVPNVNFGRNLGFARIAIRGIGLDTVVAGQEARVAYHLDGVYVSRPTAALATFFDVGRIEVVRGPQGTLYGRNATGGAVNVISNAPEFDLNGYARLTVGNYGLVGTQAAVTGPINEVLAARVAVKTTDRGGYGENFTVGEEVDNEHNYAARGSLLFQPSDAFDLTVTADYYRQKDNAFASHYLGAGGLDVVPVAIALGGLFPENPRDTYQDTDQLNERRFYGFSGTANLDLGFGTLTSVTGYRRSSTTLLSDPDGSDLTITALRISERARQFSQELRLAGEAGRLDYIVGAYYFDEDIYGQTLISPQRSPIPPNINSQGFDFNGYLSTEAYAVFGQLDYEIADRVTLSAGARYSWESKGIDQRAAIDLVSPYDPSIPPVYHTFQDEEISFEAFTPKVTLTYEPRDSLLLYATYSQGFKSGTYNLTAFVPPLEPEEIKDYEVGIKLDFFDRRLRTNLAAFYYDYTNLQVQIIQGTQAFPLNAASARLKGLELEFNALPVDNFELSGSLAYLDSEYRDFATADAARPALGVIDLSGNVLSQAPRYTFNLAGEYTLPVSFGEVSLRGEGKWVDRVYFSPFQRLEVSQEAHAKFNAYLNIRDRSGLSASLFVMNITDRRTVSSAAVSTPTNGSPIMGNYDPPRTYGVTLGVEF